MGVLNVGSALPNNTKCSTWKDVKQSHTSKRLEKLLLQDVYGTLILLAIGLSGAAMALAAELTVASPQVIRRSNKADPGQAKKEKNLESKSANGTREQQDVIMVEAVEFI